VPRVVLHGLPRVRLLPIVTRRSPILRMPRMIRGRARIIADWSPPPSWRSTIEPGRTFARTASVIDFAVSEAIQSLGSTFQRTMRSPRVVAICITSAS
jgi:hypothetical protein